MHRAQGKPQPDAHGWRGVEGGTPESERGDGRKRPADGEEGTGDCGGHPPGYNRPVREFDIVTWDRLKRIDGEPGFGAWKEFAYQKHVLPAVMTYLEIRKGDFDKVESTVDGKRFVRSYFLQGRALSDYSGYNKYDLASYFLPQEAQEVRLG